VKYPTAMRYAKDTPVGCIELPTEVAVGDQVSTCRQLKLLAASEEDIECLSERVHDVLHNPKASWSLGAPYYSKSPLVLCLENDPRWDLSGSDHLELRVEAVILLVLEVSGRGSPVAAR
jgi:hypothetical protein